MTDKWANYLISAVRYNAAGTHIDKAQVRQGEGDSVGSPSTVERTTVVSRLEAGYTFVTIVKGANDRWQRGAKVRVVSVRGRKYIRTDADATEKDNLGALPKF